MLWRLADLAAARPRRILVIAAIGALLAAAAGGPVASKLDAGRDNFDDPGSQSVVAAGALERAAGGVGVEADLFAVVRSADPAVAARVATILRDDPGVTRVVSSDEAGVSSRDGRSAFFSAHFKPGSAAEDELVATRLEQRLRDTREVLVGGPVLGAAQVSEQVSRDLARAELLALPLLLIVSLLVFRGLIAAALPLVVGLLAIIGTFVVLRIAATLTPMSIFALNMVTGLGLGLAIDYSLLIVSRYREELERYGPGLTALRRTMATAGRTVVLSSCTVALALASLLVFPQRFLYSMGIGGMAVAVLAALVSVLVLPALLALLGPRLSRPPGRSAGRWYRLSRAVMRRPLPIALVCGAVLLLAGLPALRVQFGGVDASVLPPDAGARKASETLAREFPPNTATPVVVSVHAERSDSAAVREYARSLRTLPGAAGTAAPRWIGSDLWAFEVRSDSGPLTDRSRALVERIRSDGAPFRVQVTGESARFDDQQASITAHLPLALALLALATISVLFLATGSVMLPIKALILNGLTLSAAFGALVLVFQDGRLEGLLDFSSPGALESGNMVLLFVIAFALATDYGVFLLTRIREAREAGATDEEAVAIGQERTGPTVTAAALLFCIAVGAFATSEIVFIKEVGVGVALAVLVDATIVRALLVPSMMQLLGRRNWWAPRPLRRLLPGAALSPLAERQGARA